MAGVFPGMDPYLEFRSPWPDFHNGLIAEIRNDLAGLVDGESHGGYLLLLRTAWISPA